MISESSYLHFYIGMPGYNSELRFVLFLLVEFRKCLNEDVLAEIDEMIIEYKKPAETSSNGNKA